ENFRANISQLLTLDEVAIKAKAAGLFSSDERTFCDARIVSDLRPVFGSELEQGPVGMGVMHLLKLGYHSAGEGHKEFHLALGTSDLAILSRVLERAITKSRLLSAQVNKLGLRYFGESPNV